MDFTHTQFDFGLVVSDLRCGNGMELVADNWIGAPFFCELSW